MRRWTKLLTLPFLGVGCSSSSANVGTTTEEPHDASITDALDASDAGALEDAAPIGADASIDATSVTDAAPAGAGEDAAQTDAVVVDATSSDAAVSDAGGADAGTTACTWIPGAHARTDAPHGFRVPAPLTSVGLAARDAPSVFTGRELIVWGGVPLGGGTTPLDGGAAYDPSTDTWKALPKAPLSAGVRHLAFGDDKVFVWGGDHATADPGGGVTLVHPDGAWFDLCDGTWHPMSATTIWSQRAIVVFATTTSELIAWDGTMPVNPSDFNQSAAFAWKTNTWRPIATRFTGSYYGGAWTGTRMTIYGGGPEHNANVWGLAEAFDPVSNAWTDLNAPIAKRMGVATASDGSIATFLGGSNKVVDLRDGASWDEKTATWTAIPAIGAATGPTRISSQTALWWAGGKLHVFGDRGATYDPATHAWTPLTHAGTFSSATPMGTRDAMLSGPSGMAIFAE